MSERCARCFARDTEIVTIVVGDEELELRLCETHVGELLSGSTPWRDRNAGLPRRRPRPSRALRRVGDPSRSPGD